MTLRDEPSSGLLSRREFTRRATMAGVSVVAAGAVGALLRRDDPHPVARLAEPFRFGDYAMPETAGRLSVVTGGDRAGAVARALELIGGMGAFVHAGERVLLKVNAAFATPPIVGATTHPSLLEAVITQCKAAGAAEVLVTDNPINDPATCFRLTGIAAACARAGATLVPPTEAAFQRYTQPGGRLLRDWPVLAGPLANVDRVIGLAPVKDHQRSGASMTLKNWYGLLGGRRNVFHQDIHAIITELALLFRPTLVILDGTESMMANGPTGGSTADLKPTRTLIASTDPVAADSLGVTLLGRRVEDLPYLAQASARGAGRTDVERMDVKRGRLG